ncbi:MAG: DNA polymerase III subunit alpha [bacterium]
MIKDRDFVHLHLHSSFSILDGMIKVDDLVERVKELGMTSVAVTDHGSLSCAIYFYDKAIENNIKPIIGVEMYLTDDINNKHIQNSKNYHLVLLAKNFEGYKNLVKLLTIANLDGFYYKPRIDKKLLSQYSKGLIMLTSCLAGEIPQSILYDNIPQAHRILEEYISIFGKENVFAEFQYHHLKEQQKVNQELVKLCKKFGIKRVITNDAHYLTKDNYYAHDVLLCIQTKKRIDEPNRIRFSTNEFYVKSAKEMYDLWGDDFKDAILNTRLISEIVDIKFPENIYYLPKTENSNKLLRELCYKNLPTRYPSYDEKIIDRLEYELSVIQEMGFCDYFLIVWDFINWARMNDIPVGPGRGSVGGSIVAYILGITQIDPIKYGLLFERFLNPGRKSLPDIDTDFCQVKRDRVIEYCIEKYGRSRVCSIGTFGTMKARAAVRDVARVMGFSPSWADNLAKMIPMNMSLKEAIKEIQELKKEYNNNQDARKVIDLAIDLEGNIRNQSVHAAGVIISSIDIDELVPLVKTNDAICTGYDMNSVERLGFVKMDFLGLRTLTLIHDTVKTIKQTENIELDVYNLDLNDKKTFDLLCNGDTVGVFQVESAGFRKLLKELKPSSINDIISALALYRPGPLESGLVAKFIECKHNPSKIEYLHPDLEPILKETYGVIVYQEQIMMIANKFANFSLSQADDLRKAMGKKKPEIMEKYRNIFIEGCIQNGYSKELAEQLFDIIEKFAGYGFNKSHSAAYGLITYITAYLKANYPHEYLSCLLKSVETNPKKLKIFLRECFDKGIDVLPPDINKSHESFTIEINNDKKSIRYGLMGIKGLGEAVVREIISKRKSEFRDIYDFYSRVNHQIVNRKALEILILSGCFDSLHPNRMELIQKIDSILSRKRSTALLFETKQDKSETKQDKDVQPLDTLELLKLEKEYLGVYLSDHPLNKINLRIDKNIEQIKEEKIKQVQVVGVISNLQEKITKKGKMAVFELDDPYDSIEVVAYTDVFQKYKEKIKEGSIVIIHGELIHESDDETEEEDYKIICKKISSLDDNIIETQTTKYKLNFFVELSNDFPEEDYYKFIDTINSMIDNQGEIKINFEIYQAEKYELIDVNKYITWEKYQTISTILKTEFKDLEKYVKIIPEIILEG